MPAGYRLGLDDSHRQRWEPDGKDGLTYELQVGDRMLVNGVVEPCTDPAHLSTGSSGTGQRDFSVDTHQCVAGTDKDIACSAEHQRGYREPADKTAGLAVCQTLTAKR